MNCRRKKRELHKISVLQGSWKEWNAIIWISMHRLMQGTFFVCCCFLTQKGFFFFFIEFHSSCSWYSTCLLRVSINISLAFSHTDAMLVHVLSLKAKLSFIGHEVHCFNFPSLQFYTKGVNVVEMLSADEGPLLKAVKDETHNLLPATPASWTLTFVLLLFHLWPFVSLLPRETPVLGLGRKITLSARSVY